MVSISNVISPFGYSNPFNPFSVSWLYSCNITPYPYILPDTSPFPSSKSTFVFTLYLLPLTNFILNPAFADIVTASSSLISTTSYPSFLLSVSFPCIHTLNVGLIFAPFTAPSIFSTNEIVCFPGTVIFSSLILYCAVNVNPSSLNTPVPSAHVISSTDHFIVPAFSSGIFASTFIIPPLNLLYMFASSLPWSVLFTAIFTSISYVTVSKLLTMLLVAEESFPGSSSSSNGPVPVILFAIDSELTIAESSVSIAEPSSNTCDSDSWFMLFALPVNIFATLSLISLLLAKIIAIITIIAIIKIVIVNLLICTFLFAVIIFFCNFFVFCAFCFTLSSLLFLFISNSPLFFVLFIIYTYFNILETLCK